MRFIKFMMLFVILLAVSPVAKAYFYDILGAVQNTFKNYTTNVSKDGIYNMFGSVKDTINNYTPNVSKSDIYNMFGTVKDTFGNYSLNVTKSDISGMFGTVKDTFSSYSPNVSASDVYNMVGSVKDTITNYTPNVSKSDIYNMVGSVKDIITNYTPNVSTSDIYNMVGSVKDTVKNYTSDVYNADIYKMIGSAKNTVTNYTENLSISSIFDSFTLNYTSFDYYDMYGTVKDQFSNYSTGAYNFISELTSSAYNKSDIFLNVFNPFSLSESLYNLSDAFNFTFTLNNTDDFVRGLLEGVSEVPIAKNKCYNKDMKQFYPKIDHIFYNVKEAFRTRENVTDTIVELFEFIYGLDHLDKNCRISSLKYQLVYFIPAIGKIKFAFKLLNYQKELRENFYNITSNINESNYYSAGVAFGKIIRILLDYSTK